MNSGRAMKSNNIQLSINFVEVAMLGRACKQSLLSLKRNFFKFQFIIVLSVTMMASCTNDIPYDAEIDAPKLVLNTMLQPDSMLTATVSRTAHFLDTEEPQRVADATVAAVVNSKEVRLTYSADTKDYRSSYRLCPGDEVTLTATHHIGTATATAQVMASTAITIAHTTMQSFANPGDPVSLATLNEVDSALMVSLYIDDPANETNYYRLTIDYEGSYLVSIPNDMLYTDTYPYAERDDEAKGDTLIKEGFYPHYLLTESSSRLVIDSESAGQFLSGLLYLTSSNSIIFSDEYLHGANGQPIIDFLMLMEYPRSSKEMDDTESGWGEENIWGEDPDFIFPSDTVSYASYYSHFTLETLSEDYYRYLNDAASYGIMGGMGIGEPTPIHTNIRGGLGIVGSYSITRCSGERLYRFE